MNSAFGKNAIFTDVHDWTSEQIVKTYNSKWSLENDFKWLKDKLLIPITPIYVRTDESIRVHVFLCVMGLLFMRYFIWKMKDLEVSDRELIEAMEGIRVSLVSNQENMKNTRMVVEEMDMVQSRIFSMHDMGQYLQTN
jgi:transposase